MKKHLKFLRLKKGETLVETLAAILIFTLGSIFMLSMISSSVKIDTRANHADELRQNQLAVSQSAQDSSFTGTVKIIQGDKELASTDVEIFGGEKEDGVRSFYSYLEKEEEKPDEK